MCDLKTVLFSTFSHEEEKLLREFKKETFFFVGESVGNYEFWQQFFNLFFIYHYDLGDGSTVSQRRDMEPARILLFSPSRFARMKGESYFTDEKLQFDEDEETSLTWYRDRELILSFFTKSESRIRFVESRTSLLISTDRVKFLKKIKKMFREGDQFPSHTYLLYLLSLLLLKKERYGKAHLYEPFSVEEIEKTHLYYEKFASKLIDTTSNQ